MNSARPSPRCRHDTRLAPAARSLTRYSFPATSAACTWRRLSETLTTSLGETRPRDAAAVAARDWSAPQVLNQHRQVEFLEASEDLPHLQSPAHCRPQVHQRERLVRRRAGFPLGATSAKSCALN